MGLVTRMDLGDLVDDASGALQPISSIPVWREASIMRLRRDQDAPGIYVFDCEVPLRWFGVVRRDLEHSGQSFAWWRLEAKADSHERKIQPGDCLVCAEEPYSTYWAAWGLFRGPNRKGEANLPLEPFGSKGVAASWVNASANDWWESDKFLTAAIFTDEFAISSHESASNVRRSARFTLGVCPAVAGTGNAFDAAFEALWHSDDVRSLLGQTHNRTIPVAYRGVNAPKISAEVAEQAEHLMMISLRQALAGPAEKSEMLFGKPVLTLATRIYRNHLNNLNRREELETISQDPHEFE